MTQQLNFRSTTRTWWWLLALSIVLGMVTGFIVSTAFPAGYSAGVTMLVSPDRGASGITNSDLQVAQALAVTYAELATTSPVLERVIESTNVDVDRSDLRRSISTHVPNGTSLLEIEVGHQDAAGAAALANALASELQAFRPPGMAPTDELQVDLAVVDPATPPNSREGPGVAVRTLLGGAIGLFLAICVIFLIENIWPQGRSRGGAITPTAPTPSPATTSVAADQGAAFVDDDDDAPGPITYDPLRSSALSTDARTAARGVVNDFELEKAKQAK